MENNYLDDILLAKLIDHNYKPTIREALFLWYSICYCGKSHALQQKNYYGLRNSALETGYFKQMTAFISQMIRQEGIIYQMLFRGMFFSLPLKINDYLAFMTQIKDGICSIDKLTSTSLKLEHAEENIVLQYNLHKQIESVQGYAVVLMFIERAKGLYVPFEGEEEVIIDRGIYEVLAQETLFQNFYHIPNCLITYIVLRSIT